MRKKRMFKNDEYVAIKVIALLVIIAISAWLISKSVNNNYGTNDARVLSNAQKAPWRTYSELSADGKFGARTISDMLEVTASYDTTKPGVVSLDNLVVKKGFSPRTKFDEDGFRIQTLDASGKVLSSRSFKAKKTEIHAFPAQNGTFTGDGDKELTTGTVVMLLPYSSTATTVQVINKANAVLASKSLAGIEHMNNTPNFKGLSGDEFKKKTRIKETTAQSSILGKAAYATGVGDPTKYEIAFIGNGYSAAQMSQFDADVNNFMNGIVSVEPMRSRAIQFLPLNVPNTTDLQCIHTQVGGEAPPGRLVTCNTALAAQIANNAVTPYDKLVIINNEPLIYGGSGGTYPVAYNGALGPNMVLHEAMGHSVSFLQDVYLLNTATGPIDNAVHRLYDQDQPSTEGNCYGGTPPAAAWSGMVGTKDYTLTCYHPNWYDAGTSIMENLSVPYFTAPEQQMINAHLDSYATTFTNTSNPTVSITTPQDGAVISPGSPVTVTATAGDDLGVARVAFYLDDVLTKNIYVSPYTYTFSGISNGGHTIEVRSYDAENNFGTTSVNIVLGSGIGGPDTQAPSTPTNLSASNTTQTTTTISWSPSSDNVGVTGYDIYKNGTFTGSSSVTSYTASGLSANTTYSFTVKAKDAAGNISGTSNTLLVTTDPVSNSSTAIIYPTNGQALTTGVPITITATIPSNANSAKFYRQFSSYNMNQVGSDSSNPYTLNWTPQSLGTYVIRVKSYQGNNLIGTSPDVTVTVVASGGGSDTQAPTSPINLSSSNTTSTSTTISWTASSDNVGVTGYDIYKNGTLAGSSTGTSYSATGLSASTAYSFTVKAKDAAGNVSGASNALSVTTSAPNDTTAPVISNVSIGTPTVTGTTITWNTNESSDSQIEYGTTTVYGFLSSLDTSLVTAHSYSLTNLASSTTYHFRVKSRDQSGNLGTSGDYIFTTATPADVTPPIISNVSSGTPTTASATIVWTTNESADTQVYYGTTNVYGSMTTLNTAYSTSHSQTISGLSASTLYHYQVASKDAAGNLSVSNDMTFITAAMQSGGNCTQTICITYPINGQAVSGAVTIAADTTVGGVGSVTFYASWNGNSTFQITSADNVAPYTNAWTPQGSGTYTLTAKAWSGTYGTGTLLGTSAPVVVTK